MEESTIHYELEQRFELVKLAFYIDTQHKDFQVSRQTARDLCRATYHRLSHALLTSLIDLTINFPDNKYEPLKATTVLLQMEDTLAKPWCKTREYLTMSHKALQLAYAMENMARDNQHPP